MENIKGKVVLITGASSGIGEDAAIALANEGAKLVLCARNGKALEDVTATVGENNAVYLECDVTDLEKLQELVKLGIDKFGKIDVLFANAGIMPASSVKDLKTKDWSNMVDINIKGVLNSVAAVYPEFLKNNKGHIIVTSSMAGIRSVPGNAIYSGTKHFVRSFIDSLRSEAINEGYNVKTTLIYPGAIKTNLLSAVAESEIKNMVAQFYEAIGIEPKAISDAVLYAISQPENVDVSDIMVRPRREA